MLDYLRKHHDISTKTIYNDLLGFIENRSGHKSAYTEFFKGLTCQDRGDSAKNSTEKQTWYDKAVEHYTTAIDLNPDLTEVYTNRGNVYANKGELDTAIQDYNTAIDLNPENANAYNNRGVAYDKKGEFDAAIQDFNKAIDLNSELAEAYVSRGVAYYHKDEFDRATQDYDKAIDLNSELAEAYTNRGEVWLHLREWEKAKADLSTGKDMGDDIVGSFNNDYESVSDFEAKHSVEVPGRHRSTVEARLKLTENSSVIIAGEFSRKKGI